jgi:hypothetical protein
VAHSDYLPKLWQGKTSALPQAGHCDYQNSSRQKLPQAAHCEFPHPAGKNLGTAMSGTWQAKTLRHCTACK